MRHCDSRTKDHDDARRLVAAREPPFGISDKQPVSANFQSLLERQHTLRFCRSGCTSSPKATCRMRPIARARRTIAVSLMQPPGDARLKVAWVISTTGPRPLFAIFALCGGIGFLMYVRLYIFDPKD